MSAEDEPARAPGLVWLGEDDEGRQMLAMPYSEKLASDAVGKGLAEKVEPGPEDTEGTTPDPDSSSDEYKRDAGAIRRFNDIFTDLGSVQLEAMGLDGHEIANATATLRDEMYRSQFPVVQARFKKRCVDEDCGAEYDTDIGFCLQCARREMMEEEGGDDTPPTDPDDIPEQFRGHDVRPPDPTEKREAQQLAESVNKEGQSLRELMKMEEDDQSRLGVSVVVAKKDYAVARGDTSVYNRGEMIYEDVEELVRGDPKRIVPVVDENGRVGNHWYTCPVHREEALTGHHEYSDEYERVCEHCGADLREVFFVEVEGAGRHSRREGAQKYYFRDEIVTWARYFPRLHGLDGLSPIHHIWLKQAIMHWMDIYGAAFYDPDSERYPNKFMVVHTTNRKAWEKQLDKAEEDAKENPYSEQVMFNEYSGESNSTPEVQVIDLMSDELLGQDQQIKDQYKQDIRTQFGVTNVFESELSDAGGLNNEGLQMEVTDRTIASAMHDTVAGPLDELAKVLGIDDYIYEFIPPQDTDIDELEQNINVGEQAAGAGLDARLEDEQVEVADGEFEADGGGDEEGGLGGLFADFEGEQPLVGEKADPLSEGHDLDPGTGEGVCERTGEPIGAETWGELDRDCPHCGEPLLAESVKEGYDGGPGRPWRTSGPDRTPSEERGEDGAERKHREKMSALAEKADVPTFTIVATEDDDRFDTGAELGWGVEFPNSGCYVDWNVDAWPDEEQLGGPHVSEYDSVEDASTVAEGRIVFEEGEEGNEDGGPDPQRKEEMVEAVRKLDDAYEHIVWADETNKAEPFWDESDVVPDFVRETISDVIPSALDLDIESLPGVTGSRLIQTFEDNLTQSQGWSLDSITRDLVRNFGVDRDNAEVVARTETSKILNQAREEGYERAGALSDDDRKFHWKGPQDWRTTDACEWMKQVTGYSSSSDMIGKYGAPKTIDTVGEPVTYDQLIELEKEAVDKFFPHLDFRKHSLHPNERHTFSETFKMEDPTTGEEAEVDYDWSPAVPDAGTWEAA